MSGHAILSPSSAYRWIEAGCTGSPALNYGREDNGNKYADEGTAAHGLLEWCLTTGKPAAEFPFPVIHVREDGNAYYSEDQPEHLTIRNSFEADEEMREHIQVVLDDMLRHARDNEIVAEQRVSFAATLGIDDKMDPTDPESDDLASGTADGRVCDFVDNSVQMHDLKYGASPKGIVYAGTEDEPNSQLALYGLGVMEEVELVMPDVEYVDLHIHQPRLDHKDMVRVPISKMRAFAQSARAAAAEAMSGFDKGPNGELIPKTMEELDALGMLHPSAKGCHYCAVADSCTALKRKNRATVIDHFDVIPDEKLEALPHSKPAEVEAIFQKPVPSPDDLSLLETFIESVTTHVRGKLKAGEGEAGVYHGWKLVKGKKGARAWVKEKLAAVEELFKKKFRLKSDEMYTRKLITPTQAERILKESPARWEQVNTEEFITQSNGSESLAPAGDKRPAITHASVRDAFDDLTGDDSINDLIGE